MTYQAAMVLDELEHEEAKMKYFQYGMSKRIKCPYCEHKGRSLLEESTPITAWLLCFAVFFVAPTLSIMVQKKIIFNVQDNN